MMTPLTIIQSFFATIFIIGFVLGIRLLGLLALKAHDVPGEEDDSQQR